MGQVCSIPISSPNRWASPPASLPTWRSTFSSSSATSTRASLRRPWSSTVRAQWAELLRIPLARLKVVPTEIGGGFGGKIRVYLEPVAAVLSLKTGRPVKVLMNRAEVFEGTGPTPGSYILVKLGTDGAGRLVAG